MFCYILICQFSGAFFGLIFAFMSLFHPYAYNASFMGIPEDKVALLQPNLPIVTGWGGFQVEMWGSFVFVLINLIVKTRRTGPTNDGFIGCWLIALTLLCMIVCASPHTGGGLNPAVGFAQTMWAVWNFGI